MLKFYKKDTSQHIQHIFTDASKIMKHTLRAVLILQQREVFFIDDTSIKL